jgi:hypothetical protein
MISQLAETLMHFSSATAINFFSWDLFDSSPIPLSELQSALLKPDELFLRRKFAIGSACLLAYDACEWTWWLDDLLLWPFICHLACLFIYPFQF